MVIFVALNMGVDEDDVEVVALEGVGHIRVVIECQIVRYRGYFLAVDDNNDELECLILAIASMILGACSTSPSFCCRGHPNNHQNPGTFRLEH